MLKQFHATTYLLSRITKERSKKQRRLLENTIEELKAKQVIQEVTDNLKDQFISTLFVAQQKNKIRTIFNLNPLNAFVELTKFKIKCLPLLRSTLRENDYMMKLDLKDAYYSNTITKQHRKYVRFIFGNVMYEFRCLPFGLSSAPRTFTKVLKTAISLLRKQGMRVIIYIDDLLLVHQDPRELMRMFNEVCQLLSNLGSIVKEEKC